ncbi:DsbA family protein [Enterobacter cloacae]|nr:DsbA family protein [Enterobacter cloacae]
MIPRGYHMRIDNLQYFFDPLCGWCYASSPALNYLAQHYIEKLTLMPCGLFCDEGARHITAQWAEYAWTNDRRIASLTGQPFSESYHQLLNSGARFDSTFMNRALTAFHEISPAAEAGLLRALQHARYVLGRDTAQSDVVEEIGIAWARENNVDLNPNDFAGRLDADNALRSLTDVRIADVKRLMNQKGFSGVPLLLVTVDSTEHIISGHDLYGGAKSIGEALAKLA